MSKTKQNEKPQLESTPLAALLAAQVRQLAYDITRVDLMPKKRKTAAAKKLADIENWLDEAARHAVQQPRLTASAEDSEDPPEGGGGNPNG